jgi:hypothetical protein
MVVPVSGRQPRSLWLPFIEALGFEEMKEGGEALLGVFSRRGIEGDFAGRGVEIDGANFDGVPVRRPERGCPGRGGLPPLAGGAD